MLKPDFRWYFLGTIFIGFLFSLQADTIFLKNKRKIEGKIIRQTRTKVVVISKGKRYVLDKSKISRIQYGLTPQEKKKLELKKKERKNIEEIQKKKQLEKLKKRRALLKKKLQKWEKKKKEKLVAIRNQYQPKTIIKPHYIPFRNDLNTIQLALGIGYNDQNNPLGVFLRQYFEIANSFSFFRGGITQLEYEKKRKNSYTIHFLANYTHRFWKAGIESYFTKDVYYPSISGPTYENNFLGSFTTFLLPSMEAHFSPYKQGVYYAYLSQDYTPFLKLENHSYFRLYLRLSSLNSYYFTNYRYTNLASVSGYVYNIGSYVFQNRAFTYSGTISLQEKGFMLGPEIHFPYKMYLISIHLFLSRGKGYWSLIYNTIDWTEGNPSEERIYKNSDFTGYWFRLSLRYNLNIKTDLFIETLFINRTHKYKNFRITYVNSIGENLLSTYVDKNIFPLYWNVDPSPFSLQETMIQFGLLYHLLWKR